MKKGLIIIAAAVAIAVGVFAVLFSPQDSTSVAQNILKECQDEVHCSVSQIQAYADSQEKPQVIETFVELSNLYDKSAYPCHESSHHLGMWLYAYVGELQESLSYAEQLCGGAIFHGVIQNHLMTLHFKDVDADDVRINDICPNDSAHPYSIERWQCLHGLGHGLSSLYEYDVFSAIERCEEFEPGWEQISCSKGVFMQNVVHNFETEKGDFEKSDLLYPCNTVETKYTPQCYHYHASYLLKQNEFALFASYTECDKITPPEMVRYCYHGIGRHVHSDIENSMDRALLLCKGIAYPQYQSDCLRGMVMTIVNRGTDPSVGFKFCSVLPDLHKEDCYDAMGKWSIMLHASEDEIKQECSKAENKMYYDVCINADMESILML